MPIGGETIGRAYVRILADGSGFGDDVRRMARQHEDEFEAMGHKSGKDFWDGYDKESEKRADLSLRKINQRFDRAIGKFQNEGDFLGNGFSDGFMDAIRDNLERRFGTVGSAMFVNLKDDLESGKINFTGVLDSLDDLRPLVAKATRDIQNEQARLQQAHLKRMQFAEREVLKARAAQWKELGDSIERFTSGAGRGGRSRGGLLRDLDAMRDRLPSVIRDTDAWRARNDELHRTLVRSTPLLAKFRNNMGTLGDRMGRFFGRGSRNDLVNFFGGFMSMAPRAAAAVTGFISKIKGGFAGLADTFSQVRKGTMGIGEALSGLASTGLPGLIAAAAAVGVAIQSVAFVLPVLGAAVSLVTGLVLALAGSLAFALVGGLVAVGGALVPFAAAIGVAAMAMSQFQKKAKNKEFQKFVKDLKSDWKDLQETVSKRVFGEDMGGLKALSGVLKSIRPLILPVADALGGLLKQFGEFSKTKGFTDMMKGLGEALGPMVTQIGGIVGKLGVGLGQAFIAAGPIITEFLGFVDDLAAKFVAFGAGGKNSGLAKFFNDAWASAKIVGGLIGDIIELVGILFSAGKGTGDKLFADIAKQVQEIVKWLSSPEGQKALKQWFADAQKLGEQLGQVVLKVIAFIDALDTPTSRLLLEATITALTKLLDLFIWGAGVLDKWNVAFLQIGVNALQFGANIIKAFLGLPAFFQGLIATITGGFAEFVATGKQHFSEAVAGIQAVWSGITGFFSGIWSGVKASFDNFINTARQRFTELPGMIVQAFVNLPANIWTFIQQMVAPFVWLFNYLVGNSLIPDMIMAIVGWFARLPGMIAAVLGDLGGRFVTWLAGVPQKIQNAVGLVVGAFSGLAGKAIARAGNIISAFAKWVAGLPGKARAIAISVANGFTNLAGKIIGKAGSLASRFAGWVASLIGKARSVVAGIVSAFSNVSGKMIARAGSIASRFSSWLASLPGKAKAIVNSIVGAFSGMANKAIAKAGSMVAAMGKWASGVGARARGVANDIVSAFRGLAGRIVSAIGTIIPKIKMPSIPRPVVNAIVKVAKPGASGYVTSGPTFGLIGEAGPEAVVPLNRPLSQVDPAVRALSAFAQGIKTPGGTQPSIGRQIDVGGITINTPTTDPRAVASEVVARMTYAAYI